MECVSKTTVPLSLLPELTKGYCYLPGDGELDEASDLAMALAGLAVDLALGVTLGAVLENKISMRSGNPRFDSPKVLMNKTYPTDIKNIVNLKKT